jgi:tetratricopeptide (TPR) repeat protein
MAHRFTAAIRVVAVCALILQNGTPPSAQGRAAATPATPADAAARALALGQYDDVDRLTRGSTDVRMVAIHARADIERGRYADAEKQLTAPAAAQPTSDAALELGLLRLELGRREEGRRILDQIVERLQPRTAADFLRMGRAAQALGQSHDANGFYRSGNKAAPQDVAINTAWGRLFLEKYDPKEALKSFQDALKVDESYIPAIVGYAELMLGEDPPKAKEALERALKINPNSVPVHLLKAEIALDDRKRDDAKDEIKQALAVNPNGLDARSLSAAIAFLEGRPQAMDEEIKGILAINPRYGEVYRVIGDHAARNYRFDEAATLVKRALEIDDQNTRAYADLGRHLLRTGDEPGARRALERAFKDDDFDQVTYNLLTLLDSLDKFQTVTDGKFIMRFDPQEIGVMKEHAIPLAKEALATFEKKYNITIEGQSSSRCSPSTMTSPCATSVCPA